MAEAIRGLKKNEIRFDTLIMALGLYVIATQILLVGGMLFVYAKEPKAASMPNPAVVVYVSEPTPVPTFIPTSSPTSIPTSMAELITSIPTSVLTAVATIEATKKTDLPPATSTKTATAKPVNLDVVDLGNGITFPLNSQENCPLQPGKGMMACNKVVACNSPEGSDLSLACDPEKERKGFVVMAHNTELSPLEKPGLPRLNNPGASVMASVGKQMQLGHFGCFIANEFERRPKDDVWKLNGEKLFITSVDVKRFRSEVNVAKLESVPCN